MGAQVNESGISFHIRNLRETNKCCHKDLPKRLSFAKLALNMPVQRLRHIDAVQNLGLW